MKDRKTHIRKYVIESLANKPNQYFSPSLNEMSASPPDPDSFMTQFKGRLRGSQIDAKARLDAAHKAYKNARGEVTQDFMEYHNDLPEDHPEKIKPKPFTPEPFDRTKYGIPTYNPEARRDELRSARTAGSLFGKTDAEIDRIVSRELREYNNKHKDTLKSAIDLHNTRQSQAEKSWNERQRLEVRDKFNSALDRHIDSIPDHPIHALKKQYESELANFENVTKEVTTPGAKWGRRFGDVLGGIISTRQRSSDPLLRKIGGGIGLRLRYGTLSSKPLSPQSTPSDPVGGEFSSEHGPK